MTSSIKTVMKKRIEVLVDQPLVKRIEALALDCGIKIYTLLPTRGGGGAEGRWFDDRVTGGAGTKVIFSAVMSAEVSDELIAKIQPLIEPYGLILYRSEVEVIRSEKF